VNSIANIQWVPTVNLGALGAGPFTDAQILILFGPVGNKPVSNADTTFDAYVRMSSLTCLIAYGKNVPCFALPEMSGVLIDATGYSIAASTTSIPILINGASLVSRKHSDLGLTVMMLLKSGATTGVVNNGAIPQINPSPIPFVNLTLTTYMASMSNTEYFFNISLKNGIFPNGKIIIQFPPLYQLNPELVRLKSYSGIASNDKVSGITLDVAANTVKLIRLQATQPNQNITFTLAGVTNVPFTGQTGTFSMFVSDADEQIVEQTTNIPGLTFTPRLPGSMILSSFANLE
jgi:hypothetical protein